MVKVKLSLRIGVLGEWRHSSIHSLTSALDGGEWSATRPGRFTPRERAPGTHWIGGCVDPRAILDAVVTRKMPSPHRESKPSVCVCVFYACMYVCVYAYNKLHQHIFYQCLFLLSSSPSKS
jgi:hypothetical protein